MAQAYQTYLRQQGLEGDGEAWAAGLIKEVWRIHFSMWEHRNNRLHGEDLTPTQLNELAHLRTQVMDEYSQGTATLPRQEHWRLDLDFKDLNLSLPLEKTRKWVESVKLARAAFQRQQTYIDPATRQQQHSMANYLAHGSIHGAPSDGTQG